MVMPRIQPPPAVRPPAATKPPPAVPPADPDIPLDGTMVFRQVQPPPARRPHEQAPPAAPPTPPASPAAAASDPETIEQAKRVELLLRQIDRRPDDPAPRLQLANQYEQMGRLQDALTTLQALLTDLPNHAGADQTRDEMRRLFILMRA